ncbi:MAG TPA: hypothetical protein VJ227_00295 [Patescibacteria group bacterium]|nr:hypothetical protein [Patescibacteria group bacterium]
MNNVEFPLFVAALGASEAGESLKNTYRWAQFRTTESNEDWIKYLGKTGQVFSHGILFFNYMKWFIAKENGRFTPEETETLLWGVAPHDTGEAKITGSVFVGDKSAQVKTAMDEKKETKVAYRVISLLGVPEEMRERLLEGYKKVVEGEDPKLHRAFKALEKSEYVFTAMKVYSNIKKFGNGEVLGLAAPMIGRVLVIDLAKVIDVYAPEYPNSIGRFFKENHCVIDDMFAYSLPWLNANAEWMGKPVDHKGLASAFAQKWEAFKRS